MHNPIFEEKKKLRNQKISLSMKGRKMSKETINKIVTARRTGDKYIPSKAQLEKMRISRIKYIQEIGESRGPNIGRYEQKILNNLEVCLGFPITRQYPVAGFFIDGYCKPLKLAIEIDEKNHRCPKMKKKDHVREQLIKEKLHCNFMRIDLGDI